GYRERPVVQVEQLQLHTGRCLGIFGPNGAGKTTLVRGMVGLVKPISVTVSRSGDLQVGYVPQHRAMDLHWPMTALDAAAMAISSRRFLGWVGNQIDRVRAALSVLE